MSVLVLGTEHTLRAVEDWQRVPPDIRRQAIVSIDNGDPVPDYSDSRKKARAVLVALLEALED